MGNINLVAVVPLQIARTMTANTEVVYNSMPNLHADVISTIKEFMIENVGFENLPVACLATKSKIASLDDIVGTGISYNYKDSVLFQMSIPDDMVVSTTQKALLDASNRFKQGNDTSSTTARLINTLHVGDYESADIYFIPFIDLSMCTFYSLPQGSDASFKLSGVENRKITELAIFTK